MKYLKEPDFIDEAGEVSEETFALLSSRLRNYPEIATYTVRLFPWHAGLIDTKKAV